MSDDALEAFVGSVCGDSHLRVEADLGDGFVRLRSAEAERRQAAHDIRSTEDVVIEMLRNARDAHASSIFTAVSREGTRRRIIMVDDGDGVPPALHERIFEPRVTSKLDSVHIDKWGVHGRGMALYSIAVNATSARIAASDVGEGAAFVVETDLSQLGEKTDQSSFPTFERTAEGTVSVRGPKNILRTVCEFALEHRRDCTVYLGSPTDIVATLYAFGLSSLTAAARAFADVEETPVCKRCALAADPAELAAIAGGLGLELSERSARRVLDGEIAPVRPLLERIRIEGLESEHPHVAPVPRSRTSSDARGLKIAPDDVEDFSARVAAAYQDLARRYYLEPTVHPEVRVGKDRITIAISVTKLS
ncbi:MULTISPECIES: ATP-binding protein [Gordonibacter]|uniref:ATP-binding protein n=1 Tax=Gordonibacter faecis TaxID=3047475 RepID=A0ABT7DIG9_9ACTN|nr:MULTISPECIES: ATP-binding protein [unclassified Gordonibacter]MDJ1649318.1 ATP-binding protein [Gordonibacter sp. KGMB12511]HIW75215.1 ATP-binding protein [Candidatus Gordonibacter avicola]